MMGEIEFKLERHIATLSTSRTGITVELNIVTFADNPTKIDLRRWKDGKPRKGISLTQEETEFLYRALGALLEDNPKQIG